MLRAFEEVSLTFDEDFTCRNYTERACVKMSGFFISLKQNGFSQTFIVFTEKMCLRNNCLK